MIYHRYRFGFIGNIKVFLCKVFGHRLNERPDHHWCGRCGLAYEECYYPDDYWVKSGIVNVKQCNKIDALERKVEEQKAEIRKVIGERESYRILFESLNH